MTTILSEQIGMLEHAAAMELRGTVSEVRGLAVRVCDLPVPIGSLVRIEPLAGLSRSSHRRDAPRATEDGALIHGEVVAFDQDQTIVIPLGSTAGICRGDVVVAEQFVPQVSVGEAVLGRVLDASAAPIDGAGALSERVTRPLTRTPIEPMERPLIDTPLVTGIRAIDGFVTLGCGQRLGVFAPPGVGKSILLGMMAQRTSAAVNVIALVGERGREVVDFVENHLGPEGLARSVVICATSDEPALQRVRAALVATTIAEYFRDQNLDVLLMMDSLTRYCHALRQIGLSAGEPPTTKGYPPSMFAQIPALLERCGRTSRGSITGLFAVLVEGDDMDDPVADAARGVLDGHVVLSRKLAHRGHWPAIDLLESMSRIADDVTDAAQQSIRSEVLRLLNAYVEVEDLLNIGAYVSGSNPEYDVAIECKPAIDRFVRQGRHESVERGDLSRTTRQLEALMQQITETRRKFQQPANRVPQGPTGHPPGQPVRAVRTRPQPVG